MDADSIEYNLIPICPCGKGKLLIKPAGPTAKHVGRIYYKCPVSCGYWKWCDDYHQEAASEIIPKYVLNQVYKPKARLDGSTSATSTPRYEPSSIDSPTGRRRHSSHLESQITYLFMGAVLVLLGVIIGKLL